MAKPRMLAASFGTTRTDTREKNIGAVERDLARCFPDWEVRRVFTSRTVRAALRRQGMAVDDVPAALAAAREAGVDAVAVLPTHLLHGEEYEKLERQLAERAGDFAVLRLGKPLLAETSDLLAVADALAQTFPARPGRCVALMGHGSRRRANNVYPALEYMLRQRGREDIFIGTVDAYPTLEQVLTQLRKSGRDTVTLAPLMLVAGDHAENDLAGDGPESWKSVLAGEGFRVETELRGLGECAAIRALYVEHARELALS